MNYTLIFLLVSLAAFLAPELLEFFVEDHSITSTTLLYNKSIVNKILNDNFNSDDSLTNSLKIRYKEMKYAWNQINHENNIECENFSQYRTDTSKLDDLLYKKTLNKDYVEFMKKSVNKLTKTYLIPANNQNIRMITLNPTSHLFNETTGKFGFFIQ